MFYELNRIVPFTRLTIPAELAASRDRLLVLVCKANSTLTVNAGVAGLWWPLRGSAVAAAADSHFAFDRRSIVVTDSQRAHDISIRSNSTALAIVGSQGLWGSVVSSLCAHAAAEPALFPAVHPAGRQICRLLIRFIRTLKRGVGMLAPSDIISLGIVAGHLQHAFAPLIARCPGQNEAKQKAAFLRLQRIRNFISSSAQGEVNVKTLAAMANYSVWHFIRVYDSVFGETPYEHISRCRVDRAKRLLEASAQCVSDIALSVGFENRATLTRALKKRYGISANQIRQAHAAALA